MSKLLRKKSGAPPFKPTTLSGCQLWLTADSLALVDNDPISTWADKSGASHDATQTGGARPVFFTNKINGHPAVKFLASSSQYFNVATLSSAKPYTVFFVYEKLGSTDAMMSLLGTGGNFTFLDFVDANCYSSARGQNYTTAAAGFTAWTLMTQITANATGSNTTFRKNGASFSVSYNSDISDATDFIYLGGNYSSSTYFGNGYIAEIIFYNRELNSTEYGQVETYLNSKYAIF